MKSINNIKSDMQTYSDDDDGYVNVTNKRNKSSRIIETPSRPDRQQWLNDLCWTEWTQEEMEQGIPQKLIASYLQ